MKKRILGQHRTIAEASAVESPIRQETIGFPAHFFARAHNFVVVKKSRHEKYLFLICFFKSRHEEYFCRSCFFKSGHGQ